jgi:hypothetical protein
MSPAARWGDEEERPLTWRDVVIVIGCVLALALASGLIGMVR